MNISTSASHPSTNRLVALPIPTEEEVKRFQELYQMRCGVLLEEAEALDAATRLVQFIFLTRHAVPFLRSQKP